MRNGEHYVLRDVDGTPITEAKGRAIVTKHYRLDPQRRDNIRHKLMRERRKQAAGRASQKSQSAPASRPTTNKPTSPHPAQHSLGTQRTATTICAALAALQPWKPGPVPPAPSTAQRCARGAEHRQRGPAG